LLVAFEWARDLWRGATAIAPDTVANFNDQRRGLRPYRCPPPT
jgi:hypothetical protein